MKKIALLALLCAFNIWSEEKKLKGLYCGTRGNFWGTLASDLIIPDYFPPDNFIARLFLVNPFFIDVGICEQNYEPVNFGLACSTHDMCYATRGALKDNCDHNLVKAWIKSCQERYENTTETGSYCLDSCVLMAEFMYDSLRYDDGNFCPSCIAFEKSQARARYFTPLR